MLKAVIFDLDGVLVTTDNFHFLAWKGLADKLGLAFDRHVNHQLRGVSREASLMKIYEHNKRTLPDQDTFKSQCAEKNQQYVELIKTMTPQDILPGALDLLKALKAAGIKTGIASASKNTPMVLERTGLASYIDAVSDGNCVKNSKPDPEVFLVAADKLSCEPSSCIGIEDAAAGVESIHRAGMIAVGIGDQTAESEYQVSAISEITIDVLTDLFQKNPLGTTVTA